LSTDHTHEETRQPKQKAESQDAADETGFNPVTGEGYCGYRNGTNHHWREEHYQNDTSGHLQ